MKAYYTKQEYEKKGDYLGPISKQIRICVACGNHDVVEYKHGISCTRCGTCFYFGRNDLT
jgi:hypothetical protein